jgi:hypothetical protein
VNLAIMQQPISDGRNAFLLVKIKYLQLNTEAIQTPILFL